MRIETSRVYVYENIDTEMSLSNGYKRYNLVWKQTIDNVSLHEIIFIFIPAY